MPRDVTLLVNPAAGRGRAGWAADLAAAELRSVGLDVRRVQGGGGAESADLARSAVADGTDALVVVGGDGMAHLGAAAVADSNVPLGVVPAGTGNDLARMLGLSRTDPREAALAVVAGLERGRVRRLDVARTGEDGVLTVVATGFDAQVSERGNRMRWPRGPGRYVLATLAELGGFRPLPYVLELDGQRVETEAMLVAVGNGESYGGGLRICAGARPDDGLLDVVVIGPMSRAGLLRTFPRLSSGRHTGHPAFARHRVRSVRLHSPDGVAYGDGERIGPLPLTVEVDPGALLVCAP